MSKDYTLYDQIKDHQKLRAIYVASLYKNVLAYRLRLNLARKLEQLILPNLLKLAGLFGQQVISQIRSDIETHKGIMTENENKYSSLKLARNDPEKYELTLKKSS